ncbi:MAG TPA: PRC-barrel domain-containing protein [Thermoanaerobaculia bacterium]|nr:PRC-barrel domain-containing protein [Thermoanaerobaculia bacterium]
MNDKDRLDRSRIVPLTRLPGHRLAGDEPDVRGWTVFGSDGERIGEVDDLLVDTASGRVRYLDVDLERGLFARTDAAESSPASAVEEEQGEVMAQEVAAGLGVGFTAPRSPARNTPTGEARAGMGPMAEHLVRESLSDEENRLTGAQPRHSRTRHALIPLEIAQLDGGARGVRLQHLHTVEAADLPAYGGEGLGEDEDEALRRRFNLEAVSNR